MYDKIIFKELVKELYDELLDYKIDEREIKDIIYDLLDQYSLERTKQNYDIVLDMFEQINGVTVESLLDKGESDERKIIPPLEPQV